MTLLRALLLILFAAGAALVFGYPVYVKRVAGGLIGAWRVYDAPGGFRPATMELPPAGAPVEVDVAMTTTGEAALGGGPVLTLAAVSEGQRLLEAALTFEGATPRSTSPQDVARVYRQTAGALEPSAEARTVTITVSGTAEPAVPLEAVDIELRRRADADGRALPVGISLLAIGLVGFVATFRRRPPRNPNSSPPPRWGRGAQSG